VQAGHAGGAGMDTVFLVDYGGMNAGQIAAWLLIATLAGLLARWITRGRKILGLWGDTAIRLGGCFPVGTLPRALRIDLTTLVETWRASTAAFAIWIDIIASAVIGALLIRLALRPFAGGQKKHPAHQ